MAALLGSCVLFSTAPSEAASPPLRILVAISLRYEGVPEGGSGALWLAQHRPFWRTVIKAQPLIPPCDGAMRASPCYCAEIALACLCPIRTFGQGGEPEYDNSLLGSYLLGSAVCSWRHFGSSLLPAQNKLFPPTSWRSSYRSTGDLHSLWLTQ